MAHTKDSAERQAHMREELAKLTQEDLTALTIAALRKKASGIVPGCYRMKKATIIEGIIEATRAERMLIKISAPNPSDIKVLKKEAVEHIEHLGEFSSRIWSDFNKVVIAHWESEKGEFKPQIWGDLASLAGRIIRYLDNYYTKDGKVLEFTTQLSYRTEILKFMNEALDQEKGSLNYKSLESCLKELERQVKILLSDTSSKKKNLQKVRIAERKESKISSETIDFKIWYEFAQSVLGKIEKLKPRDWKTVSVALTIVTGRRMAEIHRTTTIFKYVDQNIVEFTGQLKTKGAAEDWFDLYPSYKIPTLVDAKLVVKAHQWLKNNSKTIDDEDSRTTQKINRRYSKDLSEFISQLRRAWNINHEMLTYKGFRAIYAYVCNEVFNGGSKDQNLYYASILGHGRSALVVTVRNIIDTETPESYKSDFKIKNWESVQVSGTVPDKQYLDTEMRLLIDRQV